MHKHRITGVFSGLLLLTLAGAAEAGQERQQHRSPDQRTRGMIERMHNRFDGHRDGSRHENSQHSRGRDQWRHDSNDRHHDGRHHRDHERWRDGAHRHRHSPQVRGYWNDYHHGHRRHHHAYRHRFYNNYHYYYNGAGFFFPGYGYIAHGHAHGRHCPHWHFEDFAAGFVLGAIIVD